MEEKKGRSGRLVHSLLQKPRELLITIYIGNELVNIGISVVITSITITLFGSIGVGIAIGVGGSFDVLSGSIKRCPNWIQKLNLEWLYRGLMSPKKILQWRQLLYFWFKIKFL